METYADMIAGRLGFVPGADGLEAMVGPWPWSARGMPLKPTTLSGIKHPGVVGQKVQMIAAEDHVQFCLGVVDNRVAR